jgi:hypothetical protein
MCAAVVEPSEASHRPVMDRDPEGVDIDDDRCCKPCSRQAEFVADCQCAPRDPYTPGCWSFGSTPNASKGATCIEIGTCHPPQ